MKKLILPLTLTLLGFAGIASTASAQRYDDRVDGRYEDRVDGRYEGPRISVDLGGRDRGDRGDWGNRGGRTAADLARLNREVRIVREEIRDAGGGGRRVRAQYSEVLRATERLNAAYRRGIARGWEIRRGADDVRERLSLIRRELRFRDARRGGDWRGDWR